MNWEEAQILILEHITAGIHLVPESQYRFVTHGPKYPCTHYNYNGANGFRVCIGANTFIHIPLDMLQNIFEATLQNGGVYGRAIFAGLYPQQLENHGCHVHVVGKMFEFAGIAVNQGRNYIIQ